MRSFQEYQHLREVFGTDVMVAWKPMLTGDDPASFYMATFLVPYTPKDKDYDEGSRMPPAGKRQPIQIAYSVLFNGVEISESTLDKQWLISFGPDAAETDNANVEWPSQKLQMLFSGNMGYARRNLGPELSTKVFSGVLKAVSTFLHLKSPVVVSWAPADSGLKRMYDMLVYKIAAEFPNYGWGRSGLLIRKDKADDPALKFAVGYHEDGPMTFPPPPKPKRPDDKSLQQSLSFDDVPF